MTITQAAFEGIVKTKLAVYIVPEKYYLADICDIFETLNTTGTKVSTVDLIHSWLYADTSKDSEGAFLLRDWMNDLGQKDGVIGWASSSDRPELIAQIVTACYVALLTKPEQPRPGPSGRAEAITSIKSSDLLSTPTMHWKAVKENESHLITFMDEAQRVVAGGYFPWSSCPYPVSLGIYVALRWHHKFDNTETHPWAITDLNALFRAFFWRNSLTRRYDQGFLSQLGQDINDLKSILLTRQNCASSSEWASKATERLKFMFEHPFPSQEDLIDYVTNGNQGGALQKSLTLPMLGGAKNDMVNTKLSLAYPIAESIELHHIYPKNWCRNNRSGDLAKILDPEQAGRDYINSIANLMPLSRISNNDWKEAIPAQFILDKGITFQPLMEVLRPIFIDKQCFDSLTQGHSEIENFWKHRAELMAKDLLERAEIRF